MEVGGGSGQDLEWLVDVGMCVEEAIPPSPKKALNKHFFAPRFLF